MSASSSIWRSQVMTQADGKLILEGVPVTAGQRVEVMVIYDNAPSRSVDPHYPLRGTPMKLDDPCSPAFDPDDWEMNR